MTEAEFSLVAVQNGQDLREELLGERGMLHCKMTLTKSFTG